MTLPLRRVGEAESATAVRVGVFGGAFDPPHRAHLALARQAITELQLDQLKVFPTGHAWHKSRTLTASEHRLAMAQLAFTSMPQVQVDAREMERDGPTYTIDTLEALRAEQPDCQLFLIIGADQAKALETWHRWRDLLQITIICVAGRAGQMSVEGQFDASNLIHGQLQSLPEPLRTLGRFELLHLPPMAVSATEIRQRVKAGLEINDLVTEPIARYIAQHHLYLAD